MTVALTASKTIAGLQAGDTLQGGSAGLDMGVAVASVLITQVSLLFLRHNGANEITNAGYYVGEFTGSYGGDFSAGADLTKIIDHGDDGSGLQVLEDYSASGSSTWTSYYTVKTGFADLYANRRTIPAAAMCRNNAGSEVAASGPVAGSVGAAGDTILGDRAKLRLRHLVPTSESINGRRQFDFIIVYDYTT